MKGQIDWRRESWERYAALEWEHRIGPSSLQLGLPLFPTAGLWQPNKALRMGGTIMSWCQQRDPTPTSKGRSRFTEEECSESLNWPSIASFSFSLQLPGFYSVSKDRKCQKDAGQVTETEQRGDFHNEPRHFHLSSGQRLEADGVFSSTGWKKKTADVALDVSMKRFLQSF